MGLFLTYQLVYHKQVVYNIIMVNFTSDTFILIYLDLGPQLLMIFDTVCALSA